MGECRGVDGARKNIYLRPSLAHKKARRMEKKYGFAMRVYQCNVCGYYHMARRMHDGLPVLMLEHLKENG